MSIITMIKTIKEVHNEDLAMYKVGNFYNAYGKDAYIISYLFGYNSNYAQLIININEEN